MSFRFRHNFECRHIYTGSVQYLQGPVTDGKWLSAFPPRLRPMTPLNLRRAWMTWDFRAWKLCLTETCTNWDTWKHWNWKSWNVYGINLCKILFVNNKTWQIQMPSVHFSLAWLTWPRFLWPLSWGLRTKYKSACKRLYTKWIYLHMSSVYIKSLS